MLTDRDIQTVIYQLIQNGIVQFPLNGELVTMNILDGGRKYSLSTVVYASVSRYLPHSVRLCVNQNPLGRHDELRTSTRIEERTGRVLLCCVGAMCHLDHQSFRATMRLFSRIADRWRLLLDEHGRNDLTPAPPEL